MPEVLKFGDLTVVLYVTLSLFTFITYAVDKFAAKYGFYRIPELTLHILAVGGGWPGALLAQIFFRHKTAKVSFLVVFWGTVALNGILLIALSIFLGSNFYAG